MDALAKLENIEEFSLPSLKRVRVPRKNMLMGMSEILEDGSYNIKKNKEPKEIYTSMMLIKAGVVFDSP